MGSRCFRGKGQHPYSQIELFPYLACRKLPRSEVGVTLVWQSFVGETAYCQKESSGVLCD